MKNRQIKFKDKSNAYSVIIGKNLIKLLPKKIKSLCPKTNKVAVIIDRNVPKKYRLILQSNLKKYETIFLPFHASEKTKSIQYVNFFFKKIIREKLYQGRSCNKCWWWNNRRYCWFCFEYIQKRY